MPKINVEFHLVNSKQEFYEHMNMVQIHFFFTSGYQVVHLRQQHIHFPLFLISLVCVGAIRVCELIFLLSSRSFCSYHMFSNVFNKKNVCHIVAQCESHQTNKMGKIAYVLYTQSMNVKCKMGQRDRERERDWEKKKKKMGHFENMWWYITASSLTQMNVQNGKDMRQSFFNKANVWTTFYYLMRSIRNSLCDMFVYIFALLIRGWLFLWLLLIFAFCCENISCLFVYNFFFLSRCVIVCELQLWYDCFELNNPKSISQ